MGRITLIINLLRLLPFFLGWSGLKAEYRVYQYYVKSRIPLPQDTTAYLVTTTLDPLSYLSYHGGLSSMTIDYLRTWICPGYTGLHKPVCPGPYERVLLNKVKKPRESESESKTEPVPLP